MVKGTIDQRASLTCSSRDIEELDSPDHVSPDGIAIVTFLELVTPPSVDGLQIASLEKLARNRSPS